MPIPDEHGPLYDDLHFSSNQSYGDVLRALGRRGVRYPGHGVVPIGEARAHLDPDLAIDVIPRAEGWRPAFGQVGAAQSHLLNQGVTVGDIFLFFGWYRQTVASGSAIRFARRARDLHVLWGYLQIGEVVTSGEMGGLGVGLAEHPHVAFRGRKRFAVNNTLYVAAVQLSLAPHLPGAGVFRSFTEGLTLTKPGATRSVWQLPASFHPTLTTTPMSGNRVSSWIMEEGSAELRSAPIGQEFVVDANEGILRWASDLICAGCEARDD